MNLWYQLGLFLFAVCLILVACQLQLIKDELCKNYESEHKPKLQKAIYGFFGIGGGLILILCGWIMFSNRRMSNNKNFNMENNTSIWTKPLQG